MTTWEDIKKELNEHFAEFERIYKCLNVKRPIKTETRDSHAENIVAAYNSIITLFNTHKLILTEPQKSNVTSLIHKIRDRLLKLFSFIKINVKIPVNLKDTISFEIINSDTDEPESDTEDNMTQTAAEFMRLAAQTLNVKYSGDPLGLPSFLNSVTLLESLAPDAHRDLLKQFIISKLDGKALEAIPSEPATLQIVKDALKANLKPDNSDILEGRILALRQDRLTLQEFAKQAEELTDSLKRTYIVEGMTQEKANELTVKRTIEMCRANTRSLIVKSVLASTSFLDAKSVISKLVVESATDTKEKQILSFHSYRGGNNHFRGNNRNTFRQFNNNRYNGNNNNYNYQQNQRPNNSFNRNSPGQNNSSNTNSNRNNQSNNNSYRGNNRGNYRGNGNGNNGRGNNASVRFFGTGNENFPQTRSLGDTTNNTMQNTDSMRQ